MTHRTLTAERQRESIVPQVPQQGQEDPMMLDARPSLESPEHLVGKRDRDPHPNTTPSAVDHLRVLRAHHRCGSRRRRRRRICGGGTSLALRG